MQSALYLRASGSRAECRIRCVVFLIVADSHADTVVTPINDSFTDLDVMAKIDSKPLDTSSPSIYSQMLWEQKMERASRDKGSIDWVVVRNRYPWPS